MDTRGATHHVDKLGEFELDADGEGVGGVAHRPHQLVVVGQQVVIETLCVRIAHIDHGITVAG